MGDACALMRVADLVELATLVDRLSRRGARDAPEKASGELRRICKPDDAASSQGLVVKWR